ncbi:MAG TPA: glycosyltransferase [Chitinophagaceae bacterium]|nr:glycosyltransferase [Chitinophagaceae bacterium]
MGGGKKNEIRILGLVSYNFLPAKMGGQKGIGLFYSFFCKKVNLVCVTTKSNDPKAAEYEVLNILSNSPLRYVNVFYFFTLCKIIRQKQITHLQIEHPYYGWLALMLQSFCGVKLILHSHNIEGERFKALGKWWANILLRYEKRIHRRADYIFFVTDEDRQYSINRFGVQAVKCITTPYGIEWGEAPSEEERAEAKKTLAAQYNFSPNERVLLLNGSFNYKPNLDALLYVINKLTPIFLATPGFTCKIFICGKGIPANISSVSYPNVYIAGFVDDISVYFKGADIFLNPVSSGGGIKTKVVEALGYDLFVVSLQDGSIGIPADITGEKLVIIADDNDADAFASAVMALQDKTAHIPAAYFDYFYWEGIAERAAEFVTQYFYLQ